MGKIYQRTRTSQVCVSHGWGGCGSRRHSAGVFFDFKAMGKIYQKDEPWPGRTTSPHVFKATARPRKEKAFSYAMWDMGRLYAFHECEVIVLPELDSLNTFPGGDVWGMVNSRPYENRLASLALRFTAVSPI